MFKRALLFTCIAIASASIVAAPPLHAANERSDRLLGDARRQLERGDTRAAIIQLRNALRADPSNVPARFELGMASLRVGALGDAETFLDGAREGGFDPTRVLPPLGAVLLMQGRFERALAIFTPGDRSPALEAEVRRVRGAALLGRGRADEAEQAYREALELQPSAAIHVGLARVAAARRDGEAMRSQIDQALAIDPGYPDALLARADVRRGTGDLSGALDDLGRVIAGDERNFLARIQRAAIEIQQNRLDDANADIDAALAIAPRNQYALYHRALARFRAGDMAGAAQVMQEIQSFANDFIPALYLQGAINYAQNRMEQAKRVLSRAVLLAPDSVQARRLLGAVQLRMGEVRQAYDGLREALQRAPEDAGILGLLGEASLRLGRNDEAAQYFERGVQAPGAASAMTTGLAIANLGAGRTEAAIDQLEHLVARDPQSAQAVQLLIVTHLRARQFDRAEAVANGLKQRLPDSPVPELYLGVIAGTRGDAAASERHFRAALAISPGFAPAAMNLAAALVAQNKLDDAEAALRGLLERTPNSIRVMTMLAELASRRNRPEAAIEWLTRAVQADPSALDPKLRLMAAYLSRNEPARAVPLITQALNVAPANPRALEMAGRVYLAVGDNANAVATFRRLVTVSGRNAPSLYLLARAQIAAGDQTAGRGSLDDAIATDRRYVPALRDRINLEREANGPDAAVELAQRYGREDPASALPDLALGDLLVRIGRPAEALQAYEAAMEKGQVAEAAIKAFETRVRLGQADEAVRRAQAWLERYPRADAVRFVLSNHFILQRRYADALRETSALAAAEPSNMIVLNNLAWLYGELDDPRSLESADRVMALAPNDPTVAGTVGWIYVKNGRTSQGLELLRRSVAAAPANRNTKYQLAAALARGDGAAEARQILEGILNDDARFLLRSEAELLLASLRRQ